MHGALSPIRPQLKLATCMKSFPLLVAFAVGLFPAYAQKPKDLPADARVLKDVAYVADGHANQKLDLYLPAKPAGPLLVWIHGGGWRGGTKNNPPGLALVGKRFAVASVEYRFSQHAIFPAQIEDCKAAIRWLRAHASEYGYDPKRVGVWGASAGISSRCSR